MGRSRKGEKGVQEKKKKNDQSKGGGRVATGKSYGNRRGGEGGGKIEKEENKLAGE